MPLRELAITQDGCEPINDGSKPTGIFRFSNGVDLTLVGFGPGSGKIEVLGLVSIILNFTRIEPKYETDVGPNQHKK